MKGSAVVLLSGGMDSAVALADTIAHGYDVHAISFRYGQRHAIEVDCAQGIAWSAGVRHVVVDIDLTVFGGSALTSDQAVPHSGTTAGIPITYVPARNTIFLSYALAYAETVGAHRIVIGANADDADGYPDCRPAYVAAYEQMANLATRAGVEGTGMRIVAPLISFTKADIVRYGSELDVHFGNTHSCYDPTGIRPCRTCDACRVRANGFAEAGISDPLEQA